MSLESIINDAKNKMLQSIEVLKKIIRPCAPQRATLSLLSRITVSQYGQEVPLQQSLQFLPRIQISGNPALGQNHAQRN